MSKLGGVVSSSSMISLQRSMHSSQMYTPGPAISFLTCRCDLPQKLQRSCSFESVGRAIDCPLQTRHPAPARPPKGRRSVLRDHPVDDPVLLSLFGAHEVITFGVVPNFLEVLPGVLGDDLIEAAPDVDDL